MLTRKTKQKAIYFVGQGGKVTGNLYPLKLTSDYHPNALVLVSLVGGFATFPYE
jgi:hypothetical protein